MAKVNAVEIKKTIENAKDLLKDKKQSEAVELLQQVMRVEKEQAGTQALFEEARALSTRLIHNKKVKNFRVFLVSALIITLIVIAFLAWKKVEATEVELKLTVNEFTFRLNEPWLIHSLAMKSLGLSHLDNLSLDATRLEEAIEYDPDTSLPVGWQNISIGNPLNIVRTRDNWSVSIKSSYLRVANVAIDSGATITIAAYKQSKNQFRISISGGAVSGTIGTGDTLSLSCTSCQIEGKPNDLFSRARNLRVVTLDNQLSFTDLNNYLEIVIRIPQNEITPDPFILGKSISIDQIDFTRLEGNAKESTIIQDGLVYFAELDGKEHLIKDGDFLTVDGLENFQIKRLFLEDQLRISSRGSVKKLKSGTQEFLYSRIPSYLEWLYTNQSFTLFVATLIPIFSTIFAIFYRSGILKEY